MEDQDKVIKVIDVAGFLLLGVLGYFYTLFHHDFADIHIQLPFLDFPIFVGEIFLFICFFLLIVKLILLGRKPNKWHYLYFVALLFVLIKAISGYLTWGSLALRHSALFYYTLFAWFGYYFFRKEFFTSKTAIALIALMIISLRFFTFYHYFTITYLALILILTTLISSKSIKVIIFILLALLPPQRYGLIFHCSRTFLLSNIIASSFILFATLTIISLKRWKKISLCLLFIVLIFISIVLKSDKNAIRSMVHVNEAMIRYKIASAKISKDVDSTNFLVFKKVRIYNSETDLLQEGKHNFINFFSFLRHQPNNLSAKSGTTEKFTAKEAITTNAQLVIQKDNISNPVADIQNSREQAKNKNDKGVKKVQPRDLGVAFNNISFRLFIWQDMLDMIYMKMPLLGFDFGLPFRSKRLETLNWGRDSWGFDGWIAAHNSYLEILFRSGLVGVFYIMSIFALLLMLIKVSIANKSFVGILLCGVLINWLTAANLLVILELPYSAIPLWILFGMTLRYLTSKYPKNENTGNS